MADGKYLVQVDHGKTRAFRPPAGRVWLEPSLNLKSGAIAFVSAASSPGLTGGSVNIATFDRSRTLNVLNPKTGKVTHWGAAGSGIWDPQWVGTQGILYLRTGGLYWIASRKAKPVLLFGPIAGVSTHDQHYGQIWWDTAIGWRPLL
jgi:hypothetical protein